MGMTAGIQTTIYLRVDEVKAINDFIKEHSNDKFNRHAVIKLAIRRFLFPNEPQ